MATTASITIDSASGVAPLPVFVHARGSTLDYQEIREAYYVWNFGDPSGSYNVIHGAGVFNASHVYEGTGTYTITLTLHERDGLGAEYVALAEATVVVDAFSGTTRYVDATGGDDGNGGTSELDAWKTYEHAMAQIVANDTRCLFRAGETFTTANGAALAIAGAPDTPIILGSYGTGDDPIILHTAISGAALTLNAAAVGIRVTDLVFTGTGAQHGIVADNADNVLYLRLAISGFNHALAHGDTYNLVNTGLFLLDCEFSDAGATLSAANLAVMGCTIENDLTSHILNIANGFGFFVTDCDLSHPSSIYNYSRSALRIYNEASSLGGNPAQVTRHGVILDCMLIAGRTILSAMPQDTSYLETIDDIVIERCRFYHSLLNEIAQTETMIAIAGQRIAIRNAEFHAPSGTTSGTGVLRGVWIRDCTAAGVSAPDSIAIQGCSLWGGGVAVGVIDEACFVEIEKENATNITIENNAVVITYIQTPFIIYDEIIPIDLTYSLNTCFLKLAGSWIQDEVIERNNCFYHDTPALFFYVLRDFVGLTLGQWQSYGKGSDSIIVDPEFLDGYEEDLRLDTTSPCLAAGIMTDGLWTDIYGRLRSSPPSIGAHDVVGYISGSAEGVAAVSGQMVSNYIRGASSGIAVALGILGGDGKLIGTSEGSSTVSGAINRQAAIGAGSAGLGEASGTLQGDGKLIGSASGIATASGILWTVGYIAGQSPLPGDEVCAVSGILKGDGCLLGTAIGIGACCGALYGLVFRSGATAGIATAAGTLTGDGKLAGAAAGSTITFAHLVHSTSIWGEAVGIATVVGTLVGTGKLSGESVGSASCIAAISGTYFLAGSAAGSCNVEGTLRILNQHMWGTAEGVATVSGRLTYDDRWEPPYDEIAFDDTADVIGFNDEADEIEVTLA